MAEITREKMLRKYRYLTNTTKTAQKKKYLAKELPCIICGKPITEQDVEIDNCEAVAKGKIWKFFHKDCMQLDTLN